MYVHTFNDIVLMLIVYLQPVTASSSSVHSIISRVRLELRYMYYLFV
jgi:hypothetical protein